MKAILFDFGGTIDTDGVHWSEKFWEYYRRFQVDVSKKEFERAFVESEQAILADPVIRRSDFRQTLEKQFTMQFELLRRKQTPEVTQRIVGACYNDIRTVIGHARAIMAGLEPRYAMGIVSNFYGNLDIVCREFGLDVLIRAAVDSVIVGVRKPDPAIFTVALDRLGVSAVECTVVGDSYERDIVPAKSLGCATVWLRGKSWTTPESTAAADHIINRFREIAGIFDLSARQGG